MKDNQQPRRRRLVYAGATFPMPSSVVSIPSLRPVLLIGLSIFGCAAVVTVSQLFLFAGDFQSSQSALGAGAGNSNRGTASVSRSANKSILDEQQQQQQQVLREPWEIVDQYIEWHSQEVLREELQEQQQENNDTSSRAYAIAFYSCPYQFGNRQHHFLNSFLWSILTNRTILWHYWDRKACRQYGGNYDARICLFANQVKECDRLLDREAWIASYSEWKEDQEWQEMMEGMGTSADYKQQQQSTATNKQRNEKIRAKQLSYWATHSQHSKPGRGVSPYNESSPNIQRQRGIDLPHQRETFPIVVFPQMLGKANSLNTPEIRDELLHTEWARQTATILYQYGPDLLFGLLWHSVFAFTDDLIANTTGTVVINPLFEDQKMDNYNSSSINDEDSDIGSSATTMVSHNDTSRITTSTDVMDMIGYNETETTDLSMDQDGMAFGTSGCSIAVHSRHSNSSDAGVEVDREVRCIQHLWDQFRTSNPAVHECDLYIMTDRPHTLMYLVEWCRNQQPISNITNSTISSFPCRRVIYASHQQGFSFNAEHGPYAGTGFLQDVAVVRQSAATNIGVVGGKRSSTDILLEFMEYDRLVDFYERHEEEKLEGDIGQRWRRRRRLQRQLQGQRPIAELPRCMLPPSM